MTRDCDHTIDDIADIDTQEHRQLDGTLYCWGTCECGAPTIITAELTGVELDADGAELSGPAREVQTQ